MSKSPAALASEMHQAARLHPNNIWADIMVEGANMIEELARLRQSAPLPPSVATPLHVERSKQSTRKKPSGFFT